MSNKEKIKIFKTVAFVCGVTKGMMEIFEKMPDGLKDDSISHFYDMTIIDFANLWSGAAGFPDTDEYDFKNILK